MEKQVEEKGLQLEDLKVSNLPELQGWKEKQEQLVIDNPYVEIVDNKTYEIACKSRTNLLKGRTSLEGQEKTIASKLASFRKEIGAKTKELIDITEPHEDKQQQEVKRYENIKAQAKAEEERIERERIEKIKTKIDLFESDSYKIIQETNIENVELHKTMLDAFVNDEFDYEEYEIIFEQVKMRIEYLWDVKCNDIQEKEEQRLRNLELEKENERLRNENLERENKAKADKEKIFEIRKGRLAEIGMHLIDDGGKKWFRYKDGYVCGFNDFFVLNADTIEFETILTKTKFDIQKLKEKKLAKEQEIMSKIAKLLELGLKSPEEKDGYTIADDCDYFLPIEDYYNAGEEEFDNILLKAKQAVSDYKLSKEDAERLKKENKSRVKRFKQDKETLKYIFGLIKFELAIPELENLESLALLQSAEEKLQTLKTELLTELEKI